MNNEYLKYITTITLPACAGNRTISNDGRNLFTGYIDPDFKSYGANIPGGPTPEMTLDVFEMIPGKNGDFRTLFGSVSSDPTLLTLTQDQIVTFTERHRDLLRQDGYATFFLFKGEDEKLFVASVTFGGGLLRVRVFHFSYGFVWRGVYRHRLVMPRLQNLVTSHKTTSSLVGKMEKAGFPICYNDSGNPKHCMRCIEQYIQDLEMELDHDKN